MTGELCLSLLITLPTLCESSSATGTKIMTSTGKISKSITQKILDCPCLINYLADTEIIQGWSALYHERFKCAT
jgi:hypothetical protein